MSSNFFQSISTTAQSITTAVALVTPQTNIGYQPQNQDGLQPPTLLFHYEAENTAQLQSDITDHFIEDNTAIQDQIALKPERITVHGFIGELNDVFPVGIPNNGQISALLAPVDSFIPGFTAAGQAAINTAFAAYQTAQAVQNAAVSVWGALSGGNGQTVIGSNGISAEGASQGLQQTVFQQFYLYWRNRTLFSIQTPWAVFTNMAIEELKATQDETTRMITDFYISFKMLRFSNTFLETASTFTGVGRANITSINLGQQTPVPSTSLSTGLLSLTPGFSIAAP
jgi:hypothetical protein